MAFPDTVVKARLQVESVDLASIWFSVQRQAYGQVSEGILYGFWDLALDGVTCRAGEALRRHGRRPAH